MIPLLAFLTMIGIGAAKDLQTTDKQKAVISLKSFEKKEVKEFRRMLRISNRLED